MQFKFHKVMKMVTIGGKNLVTNQTKTTPKISNYNIVKTFLSNRQTFTKIIQRQNFNLI